jgi:DHA1 family multidrug resistance protein-like MFS transporter
VNKKNKTFLILAIANYLPSLIRLDIVLPAYVNYLGGNFVDLGFLLSLQNSMSLIMRLPGSYFADKFNRKIVILVSNGIKSIISLFLGVSSKVYHLLISLSLRGMGLGLGSSSYLVLIGEISIKSRMGLTYGFEHFIRYVILLIGSVITGKIMDNYGLKIPFFLNSILLLLSIIIISKFVIESPKINKKTYNENITEDTIKILIKEKYILLSALAFFFHFFREAAFLSFFTIYVTKELNYSYSYLGLILSIGTTFGLFSNLYTGYLVDKIGSKKILLACEAFRMMSMFLIPFTDKFLELSLTFLLTKIFFAGPPRNVLLNEISPNGFRAKTFGLIGVTSDIGKVIGVISLGIVAESISLNAAFVLMGVSSILAFICIAGIKNIGREANSIIITPTSA